MTVLKTTTLSFLVLALPTALFAQPWMQNIDKNKPINFYEVQREFNKFWEGKTPEKGTGWKQFKRYEWFTEQRVFPSGFIPAGANWLALEEVKQKFNTKNSNEINAANWVSEGPQLAVSGGAGRLNCVTIDPTNANKIWVGSAGGGLWKSVDGGISWTTNTDNFPSLGVSWVEINPANTNEMYLATGDADANDTNSFGVLRTIDGGTSWNQTGINWNVSEGRRVSRVKIHPTNSSIVIVAANVGIYKSTNEGLTFTQIVAGEFQDLEVDLSDPTVWYTTKNSDGIYKSTDTGTTWTKLTSGLPTNNFERIGIAICQGTPSTLYSVFANNSGGLKGVYKTTDSGANWTQVTTSSPNMFSAGGTGTSGQGWYDLTIEVNPTNQEQVFIGGVNYYRTNNGGANWTKITNWYTGTSLPYVHADQHGFAFHPTDANTIFVANDGGIFKSTNLGTNWTDLSDGGMSIMQFYKISVAEDNSGMVLGGSQDNGTNRLLNGTWEEVNGGDGMDNGINYQNSATCYSSIYNGDFYRSLNSGNTWTDISGPIGGNGAWVTPFAIDPIDPNIVYAATQNFYKSTFQGSNWAALATNVDGATKLKSISVCKANTNVIYVSSSNDVFRSANGGTSFTQITTGLPVSSASVTNVTADPNNENIAYVTFSGYSAGNKIFKTVNGGTNWQNISGILPNTPHNCVAIHPLLSEHIFVGTDIGVFHSDNSGTTWETYQNGLPNAPVSDLEIKSQTNTLYAGTFGRGLWKTPISGIVTLNTSSMDFGQANLGQSVTLPVTILNYDANPLTISAVDFTDNSFFASNVPATVNPNTTAVFNVTFNPSYVGQFGAILTVQNSSGNPFVVNLSGNCFTSSNIFWTQVFNNSVLPTGWQVLDSDGNGTSLSLQNSFTFGSETLVPHAGNNFIFGDKSSANGNLLDEWLVSSAIEVPGGQQVLLKYWACAVDGQAKDSLKIKISTTTNNSSAFTEVSYFKVDGPWGVWHEYVLDLSSYSGTTIYVAWNWFCANTSANAQNFAVDDVSVGIFTEVSENAVKPSVYFLSQNHPNPFNPTTEILFSLPTTESVLLKVFDVKGRLVKTLVDGKISAGNSKVFWNGTNENGKQVSSGIYFYKLKSENFSETKKMVLLK
ncbi:choice-of-anchor J domain-containing protein [bacterium]|nr:choice-of-anchor J domain-containing protein [bacterium]